MRPLADLTDRELLVHLCLEMVEVKRALEGNGQPGLLTRVAKVEKEQEMGRRMAFSLGGAGGIISVAITFVLTKLGLEA